MGGGQYDAARSMEAYDSSRFTPSYQDDYEYEEELVRSRKQAKGAMAVKGVVAAVIIVLVAVGAVWLLNQLGQHHHPQYRRGDRDARPAGEALHRRAGG